MAGEKRKALLVLRVMFANNGAGGMIARDYVREKIDEVMEHPQPEMLLSPSNRINFNKLTEEVT
jgi:hypothetical protein